MKRFPFFLIWIFCFTQAFSKSSVDTAYAIPVGGIRQWISIKGKDTADALLLWLHGGPGESEMEFAYKFSDQLNRHFMVVQWDQRESGKTAELNHSKNISLVQMNQDVEEITSYLLHQFHKRKLFIAGNSWGGYLALQAANKYPEKIDACFLVSPSIYFHESEEMSVRFVKSEALKNKNETAIQETNSIHFPFQSPMDLWLLRKWMFSFHGQNISKTLPPEKVFREYVSPWFPVIAELDRYNPFTEIKKIDCPVYFLLGKKDFIAHPEIAQKFYNQLDAKTKNIFWLDAGHMIILEQSRQMQDIIIKQTENLQNPPMKSVGYSVSNAHSHNDYEQKIPYWMAYEAGFGSIEADIFLVDSVLYVAHDRKELQRRIKLEDEYLVPIISCVQKNNGQPYNEKGKKLQLLIDIKTDSIRTLQALIELLKKYPSLIKINSISWVITGNRPPESDFAYYPDFIRFDGELHKNYSKEALLKISLMSDDFKLYSSWNGKNNLPGGEDSVLNIAIAKSHSLDKPVRFWNAPDAPAAWQQLMKLHADFINTDHIQLLADFLK
jgi:pimeloyl-ACP methyl ester carboxylesterase